MKSWRLCKWKQTRSQLNHLIRFLQANEGLKRSFHWTQPSWLSLASWCSRRSPLQFTLTFLSGGSILSASSRVLRFRVIAVNILAVIPILSALSIQWPCWLNKQLIAQITAQKGRRDWLRGSEEYCWLSKTFFLTKPYKNKDFTSWNSN